MHDRTPDPGLTVVIADDEPIARVGLERLLRADRDVTVVASCADGHEAIAAIREQRPALAFLDVAMPLLSGLDVVRALEPAERPVVVFVTAFDRFAIDAFDVHAVDYILKPFDADRFRVALGRVKARLHAARDKSARLDGLLDAWERRRRTPEQLTVRYDGRILLVPVRDIDWIDADDNYATLNVAGKRFPVRETMQTLEAQLAEARFVRIHRSTIVNLARVLELQPTSHGEYLMVLRDGTRLTLSRGYRDAVFARIDARD